MTDPRAFLETIHREHHGRLVAGLTRQVGDLALAEEALQEAFLVAIEHWAEEIPAEPVGWIWTTARRRLVDQLRRESRGREKLAEIAEHLDQTGDAGSRTGDDEIPDERLRLVFTCCHPALAREARVALTLNTLGGLSVPEIARAFLLTEKTLAQRLVRAKRKIRDAGIPYVVPGPADLPERLPAVLDVLYLVFNEGHTSAHGATLQRTDLCDEAIRLTRLLDGLLPGQPEIEGLLALQLLQDARRAARMDARGLLIRLEDQDRALWNASVIDEGVLLLETALKRRGSGPFVIQAAIAALHAQAPSFEETDHRQIVGLYDRLLSHGDSPVVRLNRVVALASADGSAPALLELGPLLDEGSLAGYPYLHATHGELLLRTGDLAGARAAFERARKKTANAAERAFLTARIASLGGDG